MVVAGSRSGGFLELLRFWDLKKFGFFGCNEDLLGLDEDLDEDVL